MIPEIGGLKDDGMYSEERKMIDETRKIFGEPDLAISATCVRVPVPVGHSEAIHIELSEPLSPRGCAIDPSNRARYRGGR